MPRSRLDHWINSSAKAKLVLLRAPAGFGKTSVMLMWRERLRDQQIPTTWLNLGEADNDVAHFLVYLAAALKKMDASLDIDVSASTFGVSPAELLLNLQDWLSKLDMPFAIFLDEFEVIQNREVHDVVRKILEILPEGGVVLISTRETPNLQINRLRAHNQLVDVGMEDLRFSAIEAELFMRQEGDPNLDREDLFLLHKCTEGWAAGLQLVTLALAGRDDKKAVIRSITGSHMDIADYLVEDVLSRQSDEVRDFLLKTSVLSQLSGPLCDALTGRSDGYEMLEYLESSNLFVVTLDDERHWYRYHSLFRQFLKGVLKRKLSDSIADLHMSAAGWFSENGRLVDAAEHMLEAGESEQAATLMSNCWRNVFTKGQVGIVTSLVERFPSEVLEKHPELTLAYCWTLCARGKYEKAMSALEHVRNAEVEGRLSDADRDELYILEPTILLFEGRIDECHAAVENNLPKLAKVGTFADGVANNVLGFCFTTIGKFEEAASVLKQAQRSHTQAGSMYGTVYALCFDGWGLLAQGRLRAALSRYRAAYERAREVTPGYSIPGAVAAVYLADALYETDNLNEAQRLLTDHFSLIPEGSTLDIVVLAYITLARIQFHLSMKEDAYHLLDMAENVGFEHGAEKRVSATLRIARARMALLDGQTEEAKSLLREEDAKLWRGMRGRSMPGNDPDIWETTAAWLATKQGDYESALAMLKSNLKTAEAEKRLRRALKIRIRLAITLDADGQRKAALRTLDKAIRWAALEGFIRSFADEGISVVSLLRELRAAEANNHESEKESCLQYIDQLLLAAGGSLEKPVSQSDEDEADFCGELSDREIGILQLVSNGLANKSIAEQLFVSVATVKFHLRNINVKLSATNRTEAVAKARRQGLVS